MNLVSILLHRLREMVAEFIRILPQLGIAMVILLATWFAAKFARRIGDRLLSRTEVRGTLIDLAETPLAISLGRIARETVTTSQIGSILSGNFGADARDPAGPSTVTASRCRSVRW